MKLLSISLKELTLLYTMSYRLL